MSYYKTKQDKDTGDSYKKIKDEVSLVQAKIERHHTKERPHAIRIKPHGHRTIYI